MYVFQLLHHSGSWRAGPQLCGWSLQFLRNSQPTGRCWTRYVAVVLHSVDVVDRFFSILEQTHCSVFACDSKWATVAYYSVFFNIHWSGILFGCYMAGATYMKLLLSLHMYCVHHMTIYCDVCDYYHPQPSLSWHKLSGSGFYYLLFLTGTTAVLCACVFVCVCCRCFWCVFLCVCFLEGWVGQMDTFYIWIVFF